MSEPECECRGAVCGDAISCEKCGGLVCKKDSCERYLCGKSCTDCGEIMCHNCAGNTCGYCSDPSGLKKYYCIDHEEPECAMCDDIICEYCLCEPDWCDGCDGGPFHSGDGAGGDDSCFSKHERKCVTRQVAETLSKNVSEIVNDYVEKAYLEDKRRALREYCTRQLRGKRVGFYSTALK